MPPFSSNAITPVVDNRLRPWRNCRDPAGPGRAVRGSQILQPASVEEIELALRHEPKTINGCGQVSTGFNVASCPHVTSGTSDRTRSGSRDASSLIREPEAIERLISRVRSLLAGEGARSAMRVASTRLQSHRSANCRPRGATVASLHPAPATRCWDRE